MQAKEFVTILATMPKKEVYQGLYINEAAVTTLKVDQAGDFVFIAEKNKAPLPIKDLLIALMTNKSRELYYWQDNDKQKIYGIKEKEAKIIL
ncbi:hypothetical protein EsVE80_15260 [Enterococcus saigonensis]|uniref:Uncharacterized protein n=1 Tax=Enterococcus saigonensis TaxID=1805431 RepID=A0A679ICP9_9ENTE|nr:hypothetical protein [Enterococcus saigonensis]BCA86003.1 hypothetical protein EsVE80_15260 [Enterococcus saigonensis]